MNGNPMNIPPISIAAAKAALIEQYADLTLRRRASMLWGTRGVGKSSIVRQVAEHFGIQPAYAHAVQVGGATGLAMTMLFHRKLDASTPVLKTTMAV